MDLYQEALDLFDYTRDLRRDFHMHPELGFQEFRTAGIVAEELNKLNIEVSTGIAETGVIGIIEGTHPGPVVLLRFDMDALPIVEETGKEYASQNHGVMHACGHDGHTSIGLTVARLLHNNRDAIHGTVKLVFQPAEEGMGGADRMVKEGVLENPRPDYSLALHLRNEDPMGVVGVTPGPTMASAESFLIKIKGLGAHGAKPDLAQDPIMAAAQIITALQTIVSRNISPLKAGVVSVTAINGGTAFNIIPSEVELMGTIRSFEGEVRDLILERIETIVKGIAESLGCIAELEMYEVTPAVINDPTLAAILLEVGTEMFPENEVKTDVQTMWAEDMALMMADIPGCYFFIGSKNDELGLNYGHHHPKFDFDERVLPRAAALIAAAAIKILQE